MYPSRGQQMVALVYEQALQADSDSSEAPSLPDDLKDLLTSDDSTDDPHYFPDIQQSSDSDGSEIPQLVPRKKLKTTNATHPSPSIGSKVTQEMDLTDENIIEDRLADVLKQSSETLVQIATESKEGVDREVSNKAHGQELNADINNKTK
ncbi:uncharacterized protein [Anabrus simplex]|uniref:uncharacterized protein n=1 Tax=Anabrus simplex TaxID=316456 RepID=UPI0035A3609C